MMSLALSLLPLVQPALQNLVAKNEEEFNSLYSPLPLVSQEIRGGGVSWRWSPSQSVGFGQLFSSCASHLHGGAGQRVRAEAEAAGCSSGVLLEVAFPQRHAGLCFSLLSLEERIVPMCLVPAALVHFSTLQ